MCGIVGAVAPFEVDETVVERMRDRLAHRGPDSAGLWATHDRRVCLGHRRLALIDLSQEANQPFVSADGRFAITFNGEIYNFRALRTELERCGAIFRTQCDTEVLLEGYRAWGVGCLERLSGMFAFALWDDARRQLFCARDRAGEKPFYYAELDGAFVFASELKSLLLWPGFSRRLDHAAVAEYLTYGAIPDPRTVWRDAVKLPPAHSLVVDLPQRSGSAVVGEPRAYWDFSFDDQSEKGDWEELVRSGLEQAAEEMAYADVPVGTFLSGGIDSASVTAALARRGSSVESYTIGFEEFDYDERPWAETVARHVGAPNHMRLVQPQDVEAVFRDTILWHYDEPFNDYSYLPTYYVSREAKQRVTVALSGDGADEIFAGYSKYRLLARRSTVENFLGGLAMHLTVVGARALLPPRSRLRNRFVAYESSARALLTSLLTTVFPTTQLRAAARGDFAAALEEYDPTEVVIGHLERAPPEAVGLVNAMRYLDLKLTLGAGILTKVDRASMAVSLEVRPVYLHRNLLDLARRIPAAQLADWSQPKRLLRRAFQPWLPRAVLDRPKQGFAMPLGRWFREDLHTMLTRDLHERPIVSLIDPAHIRSLAADHAGGIDRTAKLHALLFLDQWLERWA